MKKSREYRMSKDRVKEYMINEFFKDIKESKYSLPYGFKVENNKIIPLYTLKD